MKVVMEKLLENPFLFTLLVIGGLAALAMTYEFLLRLCGRKGLCSDCQMKADEKDEVEIEKGDE